MIRVGGENTTNETIPGVSKFGRRRCRICDCDIEPYFGHLRGAFRFHDSRIECEYDGGIMVTSTLMRYGFAIYWESQGREREELKRSLVFVPGSTVAGALAELVG